MRLPINTLAAGPFTSVTQQQFAEIGVARISLGSALARITHKAIQVAAQDMFTEGRFSSLANGISGSTVDSLLSEVNT